MIDWFSRTAMKAFATLLILLFGLPIFGQSLPLSSEVLSLKHGESIPASTLRRYSPEIIAASIVERIRRKTHSTTATEAVETRMYFNQNNLSSILQSGFRNVHQTHFSRGTNAEDYSSYQQRRAQVETQLSGLNLSAKYNSETSEILKSILPKSAFLVPTGEDRPENLVQSKSYCDVVAVFDDSLKERMTWTLGDSLNLSYENKLEAHTLSENLSVLPNPEKPTYYEVQIWGPLNAKDVKEWLVPENVRPETLEALKAFNRPTNLSLQSCFKDIARPNE